MRLQEWRNTSLMATDPLAIRWRGGCSDCGCRWSTCSSIGQSNTLLRNTFSRGKSTC
ncbi:hypothetical protein KC19_VG150800 [Ceratodon purpureus]|uniref:Uncharacterized protein n=1 Tax=Ceratodon purpureus TaxID=3225 RepID=A0A8T0HQ83_CERPU|nr:hypothetical protein KC19_VG150800 [Ceratodon purpureus]